MADMDGEDAFLASMGGQEYTPHYEQDMSQDEEEEEEDDYDPSGLLPEEADKQIAGLEEAETLVSATPVLQPNDQVPSRTASRASQGVQDTATATTAASKPVTIGGFIEEDDEEDGEQAPVSANTNGAVAVASLKSPSPSQAGSIPQTPLSANPAAVLSPSQAHGVSNMLSNGAVPASNDVPPSEVDGTVEGKPAAAVQTPVQTPARAAPSIAAAPLLPKARLPNDIIGQFEDRIKEDPKGDIDAWLGLLSHHRLKKRYDDARTVYGRFFEVFPSAADQWYAYAQMELELDELNKLEAIFQQALVKIQSIPLWLMYVDHVRRRNDLSRDTTGQGRQTITQAYEFVLDQVGQDKDSGLLWEDYISFIKSGAGDLMGTGWQDRQKVDILRKAYQRAICVPMQSVTNTWKEYDAFEMGLNKTTGRKSLQEKSPAYMTARSSFTVLQNMTRDLKRGGIPKLQPLPGCDGDEEFIRQIDIWRKWIEWEKEDPLVLKDEDLNAYRQRILYVYRHSTMALRFWPQIWFDAAEFCLGNGQDSEADAFLTQGMEANPESCLLAFRRADRLEEVTPQESGESGLISRGDAVKQPYNSVLDGLYALIQKVLQRGPLAIARIEEQFAALPPDSREASPEADEDGDADKEDGEQDADATRPMSRKALKERAVANVRTGTQTHVRLISKTITHTWIAVMRAMRRVQGKGKVGGPIGGMRDVFTSARKRGRLLSDIYIAAAGMEHYCYHDPAASRIFEKGIKLFPDDEEFALAYVKHLIAIGDITNARAVFETTVSKLTSSPENIPRAKPLYQFFHQFESKYGERAQAVSIEKRMVDLFSGNHILSTFEERFAFTQAETSGFNPCMVRLIISPAQARPKAILAEAMPTIEAVQAIPAQVGYTQSPKRPLDDSDAEQPARKVARGESPLKGAAGRRQQQRQAREQLGPVASMGSVGSIGSMLVPAPPKPLPPSIHGLLSILPPASRWHEIRLDATMLVGILRSIDLTKAKVAGSSSAYGYGYGR